MQFTSVIATAIMATSAYAAPYAPAQGGSTYSSPSSASSASSSSATSAPAASSTGPSLTQQLFLADTAAGRFTLLPNDTQFVFNFNNPALKGKGGHGGDIVAANRATFPALVGTGSGMAVGFLSPCGFNTPHVHPRGTELQIVLSGTIKTEMLPENGVLNKDGSRRVISNTLTQFQMQPFYQGSVHTQFNPSCSENATFVASFNSEDFGVGQVPDELFALSDNVVSAAFGQAISGQDVDKFRAAIPVSIAKGVEECLATCGMSKN